MRLLSKLMAIAGLAACALAMAPTASADQLMPGHARGKCLEMTRNGAVISNCNGGRGQDFRSTRGGRLETDYGCLAVDRENAPLIAERCGRNDRQVWDLRDGLLKNGTGLCADVQSSGSRDGTGVLAYRCHGKANQRWTMGRGNGGGWDDDRGDADYGRGVMLSPGHAPNKCMDASNGRDNNIIIHDCHGRNNQRISYRSGQTEMRINGQCITSARRTDRALYLAQCDGSQGQRFNVRRNGAIETGYGYCVDVLSSGTRNGTLVVPYQCRDVQPQRWTARNR